MHKYETVKRKTHYSMPEIEKISFQLQEVVDEDIRFHNEGTDLEILLRNNERIEQIQKSLKHPILKLFFSDKKILEQKQAILSLEKHKKNYSELVNLVWEVYDETKSLSAPNVKTSSNLINLRNHLEKAYFSENNNLITDTANKYLFQYPEYAQSEFEYLINRINESKSHEVPIGKFYNYEKYYKKLTAQLIKKLGDKYNSLSPETRKNTISQLSTSGFCSSFESTCRDLIKQLGKNIDLNENEAYQQARITIK